MSWIRPGKLAIAKKVQYTQSEDGFPFKKVLILGADKNRVVFETEWPIEKIEYSRKEFEKMFEKWGE